MNEDAFTQIDLLDEKLSDRFIALDPSGYFLIRVNTTTKELVLEHFGNDIDEKGRAVDKETGKVLGCEDGKPRKPLATFKGRTAKEIGIQLTEGGGPHPVSRLDHALYLGRELQKAQHCLINGIPYVQD